MWVKGSFTILFGAFYKIIPRISLIFILIRVGKWKYLGAIQNLENSPLSLLKSSLSSKNMPLAFLFICNAKLSNNKLNTTNQTTSKEKTKIKNGGGKETKLEIRLLITKLQQLGDEQ